MTTVSRNRIHVDRVVVDERAAALAKRSIKGAAKAQGIRLAISMVDLTTLEGSDTTGKVPHLSAKAARPDPGRSTVPACAAVCVYPTQVAAAVTALRGSEVAVASVATEATAGQTSLEVKLEETGRAVADGARVIDMVVSRAAYLAGGDARFVDEIAAVRPWFEPRPAHVRLDRRVLVLAFAAGVLEVAGYLMFNRGADVGEATTTAAAAAAYPLVPSLYGLLVLNERLARHQLAGVAGVSRAWSCSAWVSRRGRFARWPSRSTTVSGFAVRRSPRPVAHVVEQVVERLGR